MFRPFPEQLDHEGAEPAIGRIVVALKVAREIAAKDSIALKAVKEAYRFSLEMSADASMSYTAAKEAEVVLRQKDA